MIQVTKGSLTILDANTDSPTVYWKGHIVPDVLNIRVDWEQDEHRVKLRVRDIDAGLAADMIRSGISIKVGGTHG